VCVCVCVSIYVLARICTHEKYIYASTCACTCVQVTRATSFMCMCAFVYVVHVLILALYFLQRYAPTNAFCPRVRMWLCMYSCTCVHVYSYVVRTRIEYSHTHAYVIFSKRPRPGIHNRVTVYPSICRHCPKRAFHNMVKRKSEKASTQFPANKKRAEAVEGDDPKDGHESVKQGDCDGEKLCPEQQNSGENVSLSGLWPLRKLMYEIDTNVIGNTALTSLSLESMWASKPDQLQAVLTKLAECEAVTRICKLTFTRNDLTALCEQPISALLAKATGLQTLKLHSSTLHAEAWRALLQGLRQHKAVCKLIMYSRLRPNCCDREEGGPTYTMGKEIATLTMLQSLTVSSNLIKHSLAQGIGDLLASNCALRHFEVHAEWLEGDFKLFTAGLVTNTTLCTLNAGYSSLSQANVRQLIKALSINSTLQSLSLDRLNKAQKWPRLQGSGMDALVDMLATNKGLVRLDLFGCCRRDLGKLGKALERNTTLRHLDLGSNSLKLADMRGIANGLKRNSTLETLGLNMVWNAEDRIPRRESEAEREAIIATLCSSVSVSKSLRHLTLQGNKLRGTDAEHLAEMLRQIPSLRYLDVSGHEFLQYGIEQLCDAARDHTALLALNLGELYGAGSVASVANLLADNTTLEHLVLGSNVKGPTKLGCVFDALMQSNRTLCSITTETPDRNLGRRIEQLLRANMRLESIASGQKYVDWIERGPASESLASIYQALVDCPRYKALELGNIPLDDLLVTSTDDQEEGFSGPITSVRALAKVRNLHVQKAVAFGMCLHARLASDSVARQLGHDCVSLVLLSYYALPLDYLEKPEKKAEYVGVVEHMKSFNKRQMHFYV
jgi:hypothetical protein